MKIGFDGKRAVLNNTGLGNYSRLMVDVLASRFPEHEYRLYTPELRDNVRLNAVLSHSNVSVITPDTRIDRVLSSLWRVSRLTNQLRRDGVDIMHGLSGELPLTIHHCDIPSVVTMHDVIFRRFPQYYKLIDRNIYDHKFRRAAVHATRIIAISECTKRDIVNDYGVDPAKIDVVYQGCAQQFRTPLSAATIEATKQRYGLTRPYIISVATIEQRKNQIMAVEGLRALPADFDLLLVGRRTSYAAEIDAAIAKYQLGNRVKFVDNAPFADLPALYAGAFCASYTSRYEGFGIPVIESLNVGTPVIVATGSCLEEAGGPDTPAVNPDNCDEWIAVMTQMIEHPEVRAEIAAKGKEYVSRFNDDAMANDTMSCYLKALNAN